MSGATLRVGESTFEAGLGKVAVNRCWESA